MRPARDRLIAAVVPLVVARGHGEVTAMAIAARAGASAAEFSLHFSSAEACRHAAFDSICDSFDCHLLPIYLRPDPWRLRLRCGARRRRLLPGPRGAGEVRDRRAASRSQPRPRRAEPSTAQGERSLLLHVQEIESARLEAAEPELVPASAAEFAVGCCVELAVKCHASGDFGQLEQSLPSLLYRVTELFLGPAAAEAELEPLKGNLPPEAGS